MQYGFDGKPIGMGPDMGPDVRTFGGGMGGMTQFGGGVRSQGPESLRMQQENLRMRQMQAPQRGGGMGGMFGMTQGSGRRLDRNFLQSRMFNQPLRTAI